MGNLDSGPALVIVSSIPMRSTLVSAWYDANRVALVLLHGLLSTSDVSCALHLATVMQFGILFFGGGPVGRSA